MSSEEILKHGYLITGSLKGNPFGEFEDFMLGETHVAELVSSGISAVIPLNITFPFKAYKAPKSQAPLNQIELLFCVKKSN
jgi:hypothetical protein